MNRKILFSFLVLLSVFLVTSCNDRANSRQDISQLPHQLQPVVQQLLDHDFNRRAEATRELGQMGHYALPAVPFLADALKDRTVKVRIGAALALGEIGPKASQAIPHLEWATKKENNDWSLCRESAEVALLRVRGMR